MLFENLTALIDGELLNEPSIASFSTIAFEAKKVKRGDLYFGDSSGIEEALSNGAYGIVSNRIKIKDSEIAWIKVKNLEDAKLKLLRYFLVKDDFFIVLLDSVKADIAKQIEVSKKILYIDDVEEAINLLSSSSDYELIAFLNENAFKKMELVSYEVDIKNHIDIQKATNFLTTFIYRDSLYKDIKLPKLFFDEFEYILNLFDKMHLEYFISKLSFLTHFKPLFVDSSFKLLPFGQSRKVIILESEKKLLKREAEYLKQSSPWAKIALLLPFDIKYNEKVDIDIKYFKNYADIKKQNIFYYNFVIMLDVEQRYEKYLQKSNNDIKNRLF